MATRPSAPELSFKQIDTTQIGSLSLAFIGASADERCGIYVLRFANREAYVGQAVDVVSRYASHRRRWSDIVSVEFAPCPREQLDDAERRVVSTVEKSASLRNILLANAPGGWGDIDIQTVSGETALLPWERDRRPRLSSEPRSSALARHWALRARSDYDDVCAVLAAYVDETVADPVLTCGGNWSLSALPQTKSSKSWFRLFTFSCGRLETLFAGAATNDRGEQWTEWRLNVAESLPEAEQEDIRARWGASVVVERYEYAAAPVVSIITVSPEAMAEIVSRPPVLDAAYELNTRMMRQGSRLFVRSHNPSFAYDVLAAAAVRHV